MGSIEEVDLDFGELECWEFMSIRVKLDITRPLLCRKKLNISLPTLVWLQLSYEKLPDLGF